MSGFGFRGLGFRVSEAYIGFRVQGFRGSRVSRVYIGLWA